MQQSSRAAVLVVLVAACLVSVSRGSFEVELAGVKVGFDGDGLLKQLRSGSSGLASRANTKYVCSQTTTGGAPDNQQGQVRSRLTFSAVQQQSRNRNCSPADSWRHLLLTGRTMSVVLLRMNVAMANFGVPKYGASLV